MQAQKVCDRCETTLATWKTRLDKLDPERFEKPPADGAWSVGQVCHHLAMVSDLFLDEAAACVRGEGERKGFSLMPAMMTAMGSFPPVRFKVPPNLPDSWKKVGTPEPVDKEQALRMLDGIGARMCELRDDVAGAAKNIRRKHPAAGWVNAAQLYRLNEMHLRHHLRQLKRIEAAG